MNIDSIQAYFRLLDSSFHKITSMSGGIPVAAEYVFNVDETGFDRDLRARWGVVPRRMKHARRNTALPGSHLTMVSCVSASGRALAPYFIVASKKKPAEREGKLENGRLRGVSPQTRFGVTESGFLTNALWEESVVPELCEQMRHGLQDDVWCLLVLDGVGAHVMSHIALQAFWDRKIYVVKMPSHTSADLQPLDVSVFAPVKAGAAKEFRRELLSCAFEGRTLDAWDLPQVVERAWWKRATPANIAAGFKAAGLYPLDTNWVNRDGNIEKCFPSLPYAQVTAPSAGAQVPDPAVTQVEPDRNKSNQSPEMSPAKQLLMTKAIQLQQMNSVPDLTKRLLENPHAFSRVQEALGGALHISPQHAETVATYLCVVGGQLAGHFKTPVQTAAVFERAKVGGRSKRLNAIGESAHAAVAANEPARVEQLKKVADDRAAEMQKKEARRRQSNGKFLAELPIAEALAREGVISWNPLDDDQFRAKRLTTRKDLYTYIRSKPQLPGRFRLSTGKSASTANRDTLAQFLQEYLQLPDIESEAETSHQPRQESNADSESDSDEVSSVKSDDLDSSSATQDGTSVTSRENDCAQLVDSETPNETNLNDWSQSWDQIRAEVQCERRFDIDFQKDLEVGDHILFHWNEGWARGRVVHYSPNKGDMPWDVRYCDGLYPQELATANRRGNRDAPPGSWVLLSC